MGWLHTTCVDGFLGLPDVIEFSCNTEYSSTRPGSGGCLSLALSDSDSIRLHAVMGMGYVPVQTFSSARLR